MVEEVIWPKRLSRYLNSVLIASIGFVFIVMAGMCVVELGSRISSEAFVRSKINEIERDALTNGPVIGQSVSSYAGAGGNNFGTIPNAVSVEVSEHALFRSILDDLEHLSVSGAERPEQTVHHIRQRISERGLSETRRLQIALRTASIPPLESQIQVEIGRIVQFDADIDRLNVELNQASRDVAEPAFDSGRSVPELQSDLDQLLRNRSQVHDNLDSLESSLNSAKDALAQLTADIPNWEPTQYVIKNVILYLQSDMLLAIAIILCGGIGAIISAGRSQRASYFEAIFGGLTAGFVTFLILKGGKFLFLINLGPEQHTIVNPYAGAFAGILAGLFTDKAYAILSDLADSIAEKVATASKS